jgi:hypothetical protein
MPGTRQTWRIWAARPDGTDLSEVTVNAPGNSEEPSL